ncbi:MAG: nuclear transport factor 2 family protein [Acidobacteriota bacterium]
MIAPVTSKDAPPLTTMDYVLLQQLAARHASALDSGADNGNAFAGLFTPNGEFVHPDAKGPHQLAALARGGKEGPMFVSHFAMNHVIEPSPEGAAGTRYVIEIDIDDNGQPARGAGNAPARGNGGQRATPADQWALVGRRGGAPISIGRYEDVYLKTPDGWRFKTRRSFGSMSGPQ